MMFLHVLKPLCSSQVVVTALLATGVPLQTRTRLCCNLRPRGAN